MAVNMLWKTMTSQYIRTSSDVPSALHTVSSSQSSPGMTSHLVLCLGLLVLFCVLVTPRAWGENMRRIVAFRAGTPVEIQRTIVAESGSTVLQILSLVNAVVIALPTDAALQAQALDALRAHPEVVEVYVDAQISTDGVAGEGTDGTLVTPIAPLPVNDGYRWNLLQMNLDLVDRWIDGRGVYVAILDTGIDGSHPAFNGRVIGCYNARAGEDPADCMDYNGHGTHIAGILGLGQQPTQVVRGIAPYVKLYAVRVLDAQGGGFVSDLIAGLSWVYTKPWIRVANMSLGFYKLAPFPLLQQVVRLLHDAGVIMVASAGNYKMGVQTVAIGTSSSDVGTPEGTSSALPSAGSEPLAAAGEGGESLIAAGEGGEALNIAAGEGGEGEGGEGEGGESVTMTTMCVPVALTTSPVEAGVASPTTGESLAAAGEGGEALNIAAGEGGEGEGGEALNIAAGEGGEGEGGETLMVDGQTILIIRDPNCNGRVKFPARYPETIAVAAADCDAHIAYYSIPGEEVDLVAPGGTRGCPVISLLSSGISTSSPANTCVTSSNPAAAGAVADPLAAAGEGGEGEGGECLAATGDGGEALNVAAGEGGEGEGGEGEGGEGEGGEGEGGEGEGGEAYGRGSGTSQAAAHVTGVVALMLDVNPWLTPDEVRMILLETAVFDPSISMLQQGAGRINADAAVRRAGMLRYNSHDYRYNSHD